MDIFNYSQLESEMNKICEEVINNVSNKILADLQVRIRDDVYLFHGANRMYEMPSAKPSGEFIRAFKWDKLQKSSKEITKTLFYDWESMTTNNEPGSYRHIDYITKQDTRSKLAEILNVNGLDDGLGMGNPLSVEKRAYWNEFIVNMFLGGDILKYFDQEMGKFGIKR